MGTTMLDPALICSTVPAWPATEVVEVPTVTRTDAA